MRSAKIAVYSCPFDSMATETKGTVLLKSASELLEFSKGEESLIEKVRYRITCYLCENDIYLCGEMYITWKRF